PSYKVAESENFYAFLDINPVAKGHVLVIPKREEDYFFDLSDEELGGIMAFAKRVAKAIKASFPCNRVGVTVIGIDVPHAHIHLVPITTGKEINMSNPKLKLEPAEFEAIAKKIAENFK
ncbi:MAG: HIT family protein, partial [Clostridia bacterium]|nr:HIT family protein [Clostridia bacterium]